MLVPHVYKVGVEVVGESGLVEAKQVDRIMFYQSNNNPYDGCKDCKAEKSQIENVDDRNRFTVNPRLNGSCRCQYHKDLWKKQSKN